MVFWQLSQWESPSFCSACIYTASVCSRAPLFTSLLVAALSSLPFPWHSQLARITPPLAIIRTNIFYFFFNYWKCLMACQIFDPLVSPATPQEKLGFRLGMAHDVSLSSLLSHPTTTHNLSPAIDATYLGRGWGNWIHKELLVSETCQHFSRLSAEQRKKKQSGYDLGPKLWMVSKSQWEKHV